MAMSIEVTSEFRSVGVGDGRGPLRPVGVDGQRAQMTVRLSGASERGLSPSGVTDRDGQ
jgi:hypothetical protein